MPWPMRFGPGAEDDHRGLRRAARPRSPRRRRSRSTASWRRTRRRRCRPSCRPGGRRARAGPRGRRPRAGRGSRRSAASEKPCRLASASSSGSSSSAAASSSAISLIRKSWSTNQGSIFVASKTSSGRGAGADGLHDGVDPAVGGDRTAFSSSAALSPGLADEGELAALLLQRAQRLLERLGEVAADGHGLADRLHGGGQGGVGGRELLEGEPRHLDHDVVEGRLEGGRGLLGDVVGDLVQGVADGELGGDLGDREAGGLGGERRGARDARVHLDDDDPAVLGVDRELDVAAAGVDADLADDRDADVAQASGTRGRSASSPGRR